MLRSIALGLSILAPLAFAFNANAQTPPMPGANPSTETTQGAAPVFKEKPGKQGPASDTIKMAKVYFIEPKDGATVPQEFKVRFGVTGLKVAKAGDMTPGVGHHHLLIDSPPTPQGEVVPADAQHLHFGGGQTETTVKLPPGPHTLTLQFADGAHRSYGPTVSQTIKITVK